MRLRWSQTGLRRVYRSIPVIVGFRRHWDVFFLAPDVFALTVRVCYSRAGTRTSH
jgi:hypothetical protein